MIAIVNVMAFVRLTQIPVALVRSLHARYRSVIFLYFTISEVCSHFTNGLLMWTL